MIKFVVVVFSESEAVRIKSLLQSENIKAFISASNSDMSSGIFGISNGAVAYDIFVREEDMKKAIEILK